MKLPAILLALIVTLPAVAHAEVVVRDDVAVAGESVMLGARTKGRLLARGGELVEFAVDGVSLGKNLSGGDGWAYRAFTPKRAKLYEIRAASGEDKGAGYLLAVKKGGGVLFIDVRGALFSSPFSRKPMPGSLEAVKRLGEKLPIVYLYADLPESASRAWLRENGFPPAPLLGWRGGGVFDYVSDKGLKVKAVVGSPSVAESALGFDARAFTFERSASDDVMEVDSWDDVEKEMR